MPQSKKRPMSSTRALRPVAGGRADRDVRTSARPRRILTEYEREVLADLLTRAKADGLKVRNF